jgi:two-component system response regulator NreC
VTTPPSAYQAVAPITVLIVDDHTIVRDGLRALIEAQPGMVVVGEAANGQDAWLRACELRPTVVLLDLSMPAVGGVETAERIATDCPQVKVLALTMHEEGGYVTRLLRAGASGYVLKRTAAADLVRAIRTVAAGGTYVDPSLASVLLGARTGKRTAGDSLPRGGELTSREEQVLRLVSRGYTNKEIGATLEISVKTVETHKAHGMNKLNLNNRAALVRYAQQEGWLDDAWGHAAD